MQEAIVEFCSARERYLSAQRSTKEERAEQADAHRTIGGLLKESMTRHEVPCVAVPGANGTVSYVRASLCAGRSKRLRCDEDVLALLSDVASHVTDVSAEDLPEAIVRLVRMRAREAGEGGGEIRLSVTARPPARGRAVDVELAPRETRQLTTQYREACLERATMRDRMRPLRETVRAAERQVLESDTPEVDTRVEMRRPDGTVRVMRMQRREREVTRNPYGIRAVCDAVRSAVANVRRDENFDDALRREVVARLANGSESRKVVRLVALKTSES